MNEIMNIQGVECYEKDGMAYLKLESVARGLGFTETKDGKEYVMWRRVDSYLVNLGFGTSAERPDFIPENIFYRLAMKAKNEAAEAFQAKIADVVVPSIRKHGGYIATQETMTPDELMARALQVANKVLAEKESRIAALEIDNSTLSVKNQIMKPKADYFDELVERNTLTNFRETAKELGIGPKVFVQKLILWKYIYRDKKGKLLPYEDKNDGLFQIKETFNEKTKWSGTQTLVTPKGRETFRLLFDGIA